MVKRRDLAPQKPKATPPPDREEKRELKADQVVQYLRRHPDIFDQHPDLLDHLSAPDRHAGEAGVVDFQHAVTQRLRDQVARLQQAHDDLLSASRANLLTQNRIHKAIERILEAATFEQFIETITTDAAALLDLDVLNIAVEGDGSELARKKLRGVVALPAGAVEELFGPSDAILLRQPELGGDPMLYGSAAGLVRSEAIIRLRISPHSPDALLALGARDGDQFHRSQGTELLSFLGRVVESGFRAWLDLRIA